MPLIQSLYGTLRPFSDHRKITIMPIYVLTGANRGLGLEFVRQLSADSSNTVIGAVRSMSNDLANLISLNKNKNIHILECDTGKESSIISFVESCGKILEGKKIDYLLNNSGINGVPEQNSLSITESDTSRSTFWVPQRRLKACTKPTCYPRT